MLTKKEIILARIRVNKVWLFKDAEIKVGVVNPVCFGLAFGLPFILYLYNIFFMLLPIRKRLVL